MLLIVGSYATCNAVAAPSAHCAAVSSYAVIDNSQMRQTWLQTAGLLVAASFLLLMEWLGSTSAEVPPHKAILNRWRHPHETQQHSIE